ncbi:hypothetical protein BN1723_016900, partial [Verticillium longisporum]
PPERTGSVHATPDISSYILVVNSLNECIALADSSSSITRFLEDVKNAITRVLIINRDEPEIQQTLQANNSYSLTKYQILPGDVHNDASAFSRSIINKKLFNKPKDIRAAIPIRPLTVSEITKAILIDEEYKGIPIDELLNIIDDDYISSEIVKLYSPLIGVYGPRLYNNDEVRAIEDEDIPLGLSYYALKFSLTTTIVVSYIWIFSTR